MRQILERLIVPRRRCWRAVTRSSRLQRVAGQWYVGGFRVAIAITASRAEGGKAPRATRAWCILQATQALGEIATSPTANSMAGREDILCRVTLFVRGVGGGSRGNI